MSQTLIKTYECKEYENPRTGAYSICVLEWDGFEWITVWERTRHDKETVMRDLCDANFIWLDHVENLEELG